MRGNRKPRGLPALPGLAESLRLLLVREQYSLTDIGLMFGVSRERIRQLADRWDLPHTGTSATGLNVVRVWDDEAHCFRPTLKGRIRKARRAATVASRRTAYFARLTARRADMACKVRALADRLGRDPTVREMAQCLFPDRPDRHGSVAPYCIATAWGQTSRLTATAAMDALRAAAGVGKRPLGTPGHTTTTPRGDEG